MAKLKVGVLTFPGSNCDHDILDVLNRFYDTEGELLWHANAIQGKYDLLVVPGGFSYGDYLRPGAIARFAPAMVSLQDHAKRGGPVVGICNGFQILCEAGLLPGVLIRNVSLKHIARWVDLRAESTPFTKGLDPNRTYRIPISHGDGNYRISEDGLKGLLDNDQIAFRYTENPNGSVDDIAGVTDKSHRVIGMMPHPERATDPANRQTDGEPILRSILSVC